MWDITLDRELAKLIPEERLLRDEPMYKHTTFRAGGKAQRFISVEDTGQLTGLLDLLKENNAEYSAMGNACEDRASYYVIGNGSNLLVSDEGYKGLVIELGNDMTLLTGDQCNVTDTVIEACGGAMLGRLSAIACERGLTGLEFASGIPGTLGGALVMNAGAYGGQMHDVVKSVTVYDVNAASLRELSNGEMEFSYRHSVIKERNYVVLKAELKLLQGDRTEIEDRVKELNARRRQKQPLEYPSAGSTFKRPEGFFAGGLIEECGLKGYSVGDASVSEKHAGFVINRGKATASDIYRLIGEIREKVYADTGVRLEPEIVFMGEF